MDPRPFYDPHVETMARSELKDLQLGRLKAQLVRCYEHSRFYREKFEEVCVSPDDIRTMDDVTKLPFVTKEELRAEQAAHPPFGRYLVAPPESIRELHPSSGTTGTPVNNLWGEADIVHITEWTSRTMWSIGIRPGFIVQNGLSYGLWVAGLSVHYASRALGCFVIPIGAAMTEKQIEFLLNPGSDVLLCTPSFAIHISEKIRERGVDPVSLRLKLGLFGGEPGCGVLATRGRIEQALGIRAHDYYGLAEIGPTFASECDQQSGLHWAEDHVMVEIIDPVTKKPTEMGKPGVLVFTHLTKEVAPMIRYWSNDIALLVETPCACGRTLARSPEGILGRADDMVIYKGAKFYPLQVEKVVRSFSELSDEFRIELARDPAVDTDVVSIVVEMANESASEEKLEETLRRRFKEELMVTPRIRFEPFGTLERSMFKAKRVLDLR